MPKSKLSKVKRKKLYREVLDDKLTDALDAFRREEQLTNKEMQILLQRKCKLD